MTIDVRVTRPDEYRRAADTTAIALMQPPPNDEQWERSRPSWDEMPSISAWDGDRCVGHAGQFLVDTTVPGGARLATGAVSRVGVLATHRRRGIGTRLMEAIVRDAVDRGSTLMSLRASEATIYGRYGFGMAGDTCQAELIRDAARPVAGASPAGSFRLLAPDEIIDTLAPLYDRVAHRRPGVISRPASWWPRLVRGAIGRSAAAFVVVHTDADGHDDGYAHYEVKWEDEHPDGPTGSGTVHELWAGSDAAELALWRYITDVDLVTRWRLDARPVDDLVRRAVHDQRAYRVRSVDDEQWLRLIDVDRALAARSYHPVAGSVTIEVTDPLLPHNDGRWTISADGAVRSDARPDIAADIAAVSAAYLGGPSWSQLAATAGVDVRRPDAIPVADAMFHNPTAPFCGSFF